MMVFQVDTLRVTKSAATTSAWVATIVLAVCAKAHAQRVVRKADLGLLYTII